MPATAATLTAWEVWDETDTKFYQAVCDAEGDINDAEAEVRGHDERISELEEELTVLRLARSRFGLKKHQSEIRLQVAKNKYDAHKILEPDQD